MVPGHLPLPALPPEVHLPEAIARGHEALGYEGVVERLGLDVWHAPLVDPDGRGLLETGHGVLVTGSGCARASEGERDDPDQEEKGEAPPDR